MQDDKPKKILKGHLIEVFKKIKKVYHYLTFTLKAKIRAIKDSFTNTVFSIISLKLVS